MHWKTRQESSDTKKWRPAAHILSVGSFQAFFKFCAAPVHPPGQAHAAGPANAAPEPRTLSCLPSETLFARLNSAIL